MTVTAVLLVLLSAIAHALWNFLAKRGKSPEVFTWWMAATSNLFLAPLAITLFMFNPPSSTGWIFIGATWLLHVTYFVTLSRAYSRTDLSVAYPIARGTGLMLIPLLGVTWLGESISLAALTGVILILTGIVILTWRGRFTTKFSSPGNLLRDSGARYALATGAIISIYSIVDKQAVQHVTPFLYMYFVASAGTIGMLPFLWRSFKRSDFTFEWRSHKISIVVGGLLQFAAYGLVLTALETGRVSYIGPFRETGILFGILLGVVVLGEPFARNRILGGAFIATGAATIALAP